MNIFFMDIFFMVIGTRLNSLLQSYDCTINALCFLKYVLISFFRYLLVLGKHFSAHTASAEANNYHFIFDSFALFPACLLLQVDLQLYFGIPTPRNTVDFSGIGGAEVDLGRRHSTAGHV